MPQDDRKAALWFLMAAETGHSEAPYRLGCMYTSGHGVPMDYVHASAWLGLAAMDGIPGAAGKKDEIRFFMTVDQ